MTATLRAGVPITHRDQLPSSSRYELLVKVASGGMATVYVGRLSSTAGISRLVAIKRAHAHLLEDPAFGRMLIAEAKLASRIHHPNVVAVQNVEEVEGELLLVMDYVEGASLADLADPENGAQPLPAQAAVRIILDACAGLHAAHELTDDDGHPLGIVHRDVSPHNILVGVDGISRLTDFGIAKSSGHTQSAGKTSTGALKGKVAYMAPEYVEAGKLDARSDVFSLGIVLWEALTRRRLFRGGNEVESLKMVIACEVAPPSTIAPWIGRGLDDVVLRALARSPAERFQSALELSEALESAARKEDLLAKHVDVAKAVKAAAGEILAQRRALIKEKHDPEVITADVDYDAKTRAVVDAAIANEARSQVSLVGRSERTASLVQPDAVVARDSVTAPIAPVRALPVETPPQPGDASTFGSGVSAQLVDEARDAAIRPPARGRPLLWMAIGLFGVLGIGGAIMYGVPGSRTDVPAATTSPPPATTEEPKPIEAASIAPATTPAPAPTPSAIPAPEPSASHAHVTTAKPPIKAAPKPIVHHAPAGTTTTKPAGIVSTLPPDKPADKPVDRAPPNPYAK